MKIVETYSHLNGLEFLLVHQPKLWDEIKKVIENVNADKCRTKISKEKTMKGKVLYSPIDMNKSFNKLLKAKNWKESRVSYWVTKSEKLIRKTSTPSSSIAFKVFLELVAGPNVATILVFFVFFGIN